MPDRYLGRIIGKYQVTRLLGTGAFAWVYEAIDQDLEIPVALKILRPEFAGQEVAETRFRREAATAARLRHRNIVTVRDVGQADGTVFVVMDLHPLTLGRRLALAGRLPEAESVRIGLDVAAALSIAHAGGIIHRDIKPDNILLSADGEAVVADFGLARALAGALSLSATNQVMGTPHYFSPEQARGQEIDGRSDLYALGVTLYRAATGHLPFEGDDWYIVAKHHIETAPTSLRTHAPELTPEFDAVVLKLLAKQPEQRYQSATQLLDALSALPTAPERSSGFTPRFASYTVDAFPAIRSSRRRVVAGSLVLLVAASATWYGVQRNDGDRLRNALPGVSTAAGSDSVALARGALSDTGLAASVVPLAESIPIVPVVRRDSAARAARLAKAAAKNARIDVTTSDSARIYVENRLVGSGRWTGEYTVGTRLTVRAVIADAPTTCDVAMRDTVLVLKAGVAVSLPVRTCVPVSYDITPRDARVQFIPNDGGAPIELRADSARAVSLPEGRYEVRIQAPRCVMGTDTLRVAPKADGSPIRRRFPLICS